MYATEKQKQGNAPTERKTKRITSQVNGVYSLGKTPQRPCPNPTREQNHRIEIGFANGFLKHRFLPKIVAGANHTTLYDIFMIAKKHIKI